MCLQLREALTTKRIVLAKEFFSSTGIAEAKQQLESEMRFFSVITEAPKTPFGKTKRTYTGKSAGRNDDIVITLQLALAGARVFYESDRYAQFRHAPIGHHTNHARSALR